MTEPQDVELEEQGEDLAPDVDYIPEADQPFQEILRDNERAFQLPPPDQLPVLDMT